MGTVLPDNPRAQLEFFRTHMAEWIVRADQIGLAESEAEEVAAGVQAAQEALRLALEAREAALNATRRWEATMKNLRQVGGAAIKSIKSYAGRTNDPRVYSLAGVQEPGRPGPRHRGQFEADAAMPHIRRCTARPDAFGAIELEWTCGQGATMGAGANVLYRIARSLDDGEFRILETVGSPGPGRRSVRFIDTTVPPGTRRIGYTVTPMRGSARGRAGPIAPVFLPGTMPGCGMIQTKSAA